MGLFTRKLSMLLACAAVLCALALSACGGDDDSTSTTAQATSGETTAPEGSGSGDEKGGQEGGSGGEDDGSDSSGSGGSDDSGSGSGGGVDSSERSSRFVTPGGDNSIQEFGTEGDAAERAEALKAIKAVTAASRTGDWGPVCAEYLSAKNLEQFEAITEKVPKFKGKSCAEILHGLNPGRDIEDPTAPQGAVASIRHDGENAFAIYRGIDGKPYAYTFVYEDGVMKLTTLAATPLAP
jgi:hypothetical protein